MKPNQNSFENEKQILDLFSFSINSPSLMTSIKCLFHRIIYFIFKQLNISTNVAQVSLHFGRQM